MSKESELLEKINAFVLDKHLTISEFEMETEMYEPFGPEERQRLSKTYSTRAEQVAFEEGIIFAKILYGIGGE